MKCLKCGHVNSVPQKFCGECGARLESGEAKSPSFAERSYTPPHLAAKILQTRSALEGERKRVTVLFCDIANSTPLAERIGPDRMHTLLNAFFEAALAEVHRYEGTVNQFLGDGFMALFGAPLTHEDHARRAVLAALAIRNAIASDAQFQASDIALKTRIGLNTGAVVVGRIGDNLRMDYTAVGDTTNVAARLQGQAQPGSILIGDEVLRHVQRFVETQPLGERLLKGKTEPMALYEVLGERRAGVEHAIASTVLLGRSDEVVQITKVLDRLATEGQGGVVTIVGEAGLGKSRMLEEAHTIARSRSLRWIEASCLSFGRTLTYWPFREALRQRFGIAADEDESGALNKVEGGLKRLFNEAAEEVDETLPFIARLMSLPLAGRAEQRLAALDSLSVGQQIFRSMLSLVGQLARQGPLVLAFEDWHWADNSSADLLHHLLQLCPRRAVLFIVAMRPEAEGPAAALLEAIDRDGDLKARHCQIRLAPLPESASLDLIAQLLQGDLPGHVQRRLTERAAGNPFYLGELVRAVVATGAIARDTPMGTWHATDRFESMPLPDTIEGVILARIDRLEDDAKQVLKAAAVVGRTFFYRVLRALSAEQANLDTEVEGLKGAEMIAEHKRLPELELMFRHPLIQKAAYGSLLVERRKQLHRQVGACIETLFPNRLEEFFSVLAYHYAQAEAWDKAQEYMFKAGDQAGSIAGDAEALEHYRLALDAAERSGAKPMDVLARADLDRKMGEALWRLGNTEPALGYLYGGLARLGIDLPTSHAAIGRAIALNVFKRLWQKVFRPPTSDTTESPSDIDRLRFDFILLIANIEVHRSPKRFLLCMLEGIPVVEKYPHSSAYAINHSTFGLVFDSLGLYAIGQKYIRRATSVAEQLSDPIALGHCLLLSGLHELGAGRWSGAAADFQRAEAAFHDAGNARYWANAFTLRVHVRRVRGEPEWAAGCEEARSLARTTGDGLTVAWLNSILGSKSVQAGDFVNAAAQCAQGCELYESISDPRGLSITLSLRALALLYLADRTSAFNMLRQSRDIRLQWEMRGILLTRAILTTAEAWLYAAETASADERSAVLEAAGVACSDATRHARWLRDESPPEELRFRGTYAQLCGEPKQARALWERAISMGEQLGAGYSLARTHLEIGRWCGSREHLEMAESLLARAGLQFHLEMARRLLQQPAASRDMVPGTAALR